MQNDLSTAPELCALCEREPASIDAVENHEPVRVCAACFAYETGEDEA